MAVVTIIGYQEEFIQLEAFLNNKPIEGYDMKFVMPKRKYGM